MGLVQVLTRRAPKKRLVSASLEQTPMVHRSNQPQESQILGHIFRVSWWCLGCRGVLNVIPMGRMVFYLGFVDANGGLLGFVSRVLMQTEGFAEGMSDCGF